MQPTHTEHDATHLHAHLKGDAQHTHSFEGRSQSILAWALGLTPVSYTHLTLPTIYSV